MNEILFDDCRLSFFLPPAIGSSTPFSVHDNNSPLMDRALIHSIDVAENVFGSEMKLARCRST